MTTTGSSSFRCAHCKGRNTAVRDSRPQKDGRYIRRRRYCLACGHRFTTYEIPQEAADRANSLIEDALLIRQEMVALLARLERLTGAPPLDITSERADHG